MLRLIRTSLWLAACLAGVALAQDTRPRANDQALQHALDGIRLDYRVPGIAAVVFDREAIRVIAVGERGEMAEVTEHTRFRIGELGLLFTGMAIAALHFEESISVDAQIQGVLPEVDLQNPWRAERAVTVDDLLLHRAGLSPLRFRDVHVDATGQPLLAAINRAWRELRLQHPPGQHEQYSIVGYAVAAYLIEKSVGMLYERVLDRMFFAPLELSPADVSVAPELARGHAARTVNELPLNFSFSDTWLSAHDLGLVGQLLLNRGRHGERQLLPEAAVEWIESTSLENPLVPGARRGVHAEEHNGFIFFTQSGALPGFLARFAYSPELGKGYAVLLNRGDAPAALAAAERLLRGQLLAVERPRTPLAAEPMPEGLAGWYRNVRHESPPRRLYQHWLGLAYAWNCDGRLCLQGAGQPRVTLESIGDDLLRERGRTHAGWQLLYDGEVPRLEVAQASWQATGSPRVAFMLLLALFASLGVLTGIVLLPVWFYGLVRDRMLDYHALVPRMLPVLAAACIVAGQVVLFGTGFPALGQPGAAGVSILLLTAAAPLLSALAIAAALAGFFWRQPKPVMTIALIIAMASAAASIMLAEAGLVAFRPWLY